MRTNIIFALIVFLLLTTGIFINNCYNDNNESRITINIERNDLLSLGIKPEKKIIDSILEFFSTPAEATSVPEWFDIRTDLTLTVISDSFSNMTFTIPANATSFTTSIPSGSNTTLRITSQTDWLNPTGNINKNWGGEYTTLLQPGDMEITITMIPMTYISTVLQSANITVTWEVYQMHSSVTAYKLYRSTAIDGDYIYVNTTSSNTLNAGGYTGTRYYYKVSCVTSSGEGVMSDPKTW